MSTLSFRASFLEEYTARAPLALAIERTLECVILAEHEFRSPVLDLGCGDGLFASVLFGDRLDTGIDPDPHELREAARTGAYRELIRCYGERIPKPDGSFQTVLSNSVLEHIPDLRPVLNEVFRILSPGGVFYFTVPTNDFETWTVINQLLIRAGLRGISDRYRRFFNRFWRHYHAYDAGTWREGRLGSGFRVVEVARYGAPRVALVDDALAPLALPSMLLKRLARRWVLSPSLRRVLLRPFRGLFSAWLSPVRHPDGCLAFIKAVKSQAASL